MRQLVEYINSEPQVKAFWESGMGYIELEYYSSEGEQCFATIMGANPAAILQNLEEYIEGFDAEEYEKYWIQMGREKRIEKGAPASIRDLLASAEEFKRILESLYDALEPNIVGQTGPVYSKSKKSLKNENRGHCADFCTKPNRENTSRINVRSNCQCKGGECKGCGKCGNVQAFPFAGTGGSEPSDLMKLRDYLNDRYTAQELIDFVRANYDPNYLTFFGVPGALQSYLTHIKDNLGLKVSQADLEKIANAIANKERF